MQFWWPAIVPGLSCCPLPPHDDHQRPLLALKQLRVGPGVTAACPKKEGFLQEPLPAASPSFILTSTKWVKVRGTASTPSSASQLRVFHRMSLCIFLLKNLQCFKCRLPESFQRQSRLRALSPLPLVFHIPGSTQISHCKSFKCLLTVTSQRRPFVDILSFPKRVLYFIPVYEYPSVWFYHLSGTGQVALGFVLYVTDPAGPTLAHLVPAPCQTGEGKQYWTKLREEASVGK